MKGNLNYYKFYYYQQDPGNQADTSKGNQILNSLRSVFFLAAYDYDSIDQPLADKIKRDCHIG